MTRGVPAYLALAALLLLSACQREELAGMTDTPILFQAQLAHSSSAVKADAAEAPTNESYLIHKDSKIGVYGTWISTSQEATDVFSKIPVQYVSDGIGGYSWEYTPRQFWRQGGTYEFRAVYPYDASTQFGVGGRNMVVSYSMLSSNYDLLVAGSSRDLTSVDDRSAVQLPFKHGLAAIRVRFQKGSNDPERHYLLNSFEFRYLKAVGVMVYTGGDPTVSSWNPSEYRTESVFPWTAPENKQIDIPETYAGFQTLVGEDDEYGWEQWLYVIPQELKVDDGNTPAIRYSLQVKQYSGSELIYSTEDPVYTTLPLPLEYKDANDVTHDVIWEPGKVYTYNVQIQTGWAFITVSVEPWEQYFVYVDDVVF